MARLSLQKSGLRRSASRLTPARGLTCAVVAALLVAGTAYADDSDAAKAASTPAIENGKVENCLLASRIRHTKVVDDQTVLFYLGQTEIYKNVLPYKCNMLHSYDTILYKPTNNQLCSVDTIGPIDTSVPGSNFSKCGLGKFEPIDKATAEKLISDAKARLKSSS